MRALGPLLLAAALLAGCVSAGFPPAAFQGVNRALSLDDLRRSPDAYLEQKVVLGGEIVDTRPQPGGTEIEVLGRPLRGDGRPKRTDASAGRFLVLSSQFLDPEVYAKGRRLSAIGTFTGEQERPIGDQAYRYPVIAAEQVRLWPPDVPPYAYPYPYPWYPYPYAYPWGWGPPWWGGVYFGPPWYRPWGPYWW